MKIEYIYCTWLFWKAILLNWKEIEDNGKDYLQEALQQGVNSEAMKNIPVAGFTKEQIQAIGAIPSSYLEYYYLRDGKLDKLLHAEHTRAEVCMEIEEQLLHLYENSLF